MATGHSFSPALFAVVAFRVTGSVPRVAFVRPQARPAALFRVTGFAVTCRLPFWPPVSGSRRSTHELPPWARPLSYGDVAREACRALNVEPVRPVLRRESLWELYQLYKAAGLLRLFFLMYSAP